MRGCCLGLLLSLNLAIGLHLVTVCDSSTGAEPSPGADPTAIPTQEAGKKPPGARNSALQGGTLLGFYRHCVEKKTFFLSITIKAKKMSESFWVTADHLRSVTSATGT